MTLRELLAGACIEPPPAPADDVEIGALAYRSESVTVGALFFCVPGFTADGHDFAPDAVRRGAAALACERPLGLGVPPRSTPPRVAVINVDDEWGARLAQELGEAGHGPPVTFAIGCDADLRARDVRSSASGASFTCVADGDEARIELPLPGLFNVSNALGALGAARALGVPLAQAAASLASAPSVPGRFEPVDEGQPFTVLVDYAHTPDS